MINFIVETLCQGNVGMAFLVITITMFAAFCGIVWTGIAIIERITESRKNKVKNALPKYIRGPF